MTLLVSLHSQSPPPLEQVGGKAFNLMRMASYGMNVPRGYVLTSRAFDTRQGVELESLLTNALPELQSEWVMVRSSGIGEDGAAISFAGQLDSFQVPNELTEIIEAIEKCWSSASNERLQVYGSHQGQTVLKMGVILQEMIEPDYAGVLFTASPTDSSKQLIEYVEGHCEKLVSGQETPKSVLLPCEDESTPAFVPHLSEASTCILDCFGSHQDVEWAWRSDELFLVQSRPITRLNDHIDWSSTNVNENYPDKLSPLLYSIARRAYYSYFKSLSSALNIPLTPENESLFYNIIGLWGDRMYYNITNIHRVIGLTPFKGLLGKSFDDFVGYQGQAHTKSRVNNIVEQGKFTAQLIGHGCQLKTYVERIESRVSSFTSRPSQREIRAGFHDFLDLRFNYWVNASFADFYAMLSHGALGKYLLALNLENAAGLQNTLIQSIPNLVSNQPIHELWSLKQLIITEGYRPLFDRAAEEILEQLHDDPSLAPLMRAVDQYLSAWGFRCSGELTFLSKNYQEDPLSFIEMLKLYVTAEHPDPTQQFEEKHAEQERALTATLKSIPWVHRAPLKALVRFTRFAISCRERVRLQQAKSYAHFKALNIALGERLVHAEVLATASDVFYLEYDEVSRLLNQEWTDAEYLTSLIDLRKAKIDRSEECPENFQANNTNYQNRFSDRDRAIKMSANCYAGLPACGGTVTARAVNLESIHDIGQLRRGDVLVTKQTDPGWICAFPLISGLIVERGGMLSHGAIVAREFGIPAVVGLKDITKIINTDDIVSVDGNQGLVECHRS